MSTSPKAEQIEFIPSGGLVATNLQAALNELDSDKATTANLAAPSGSSLVGYDSGTVQDVLDGAKSLQGYAALRAYTGRATTVRFTTPGIAGFYWRDDTDTTSADNGGTVVVDASNRRWKRILDKGLSPDYFEGNDLIKIQSAVLALSVTERSIRFARTYDITGLGPIDLVTLRNGDLRLTYFIGDGGGIKKDDAGYIFTSSLANYGRYHDVVSKGMRYEGITGGGACVFDGNQLVGIWSDNDNFFQIDQILEADNYLVQSFRMWKPDIQRGAGYAISARYYFDVLIDSPRVERRNGGFMRTVMGDFNTFTYDLNNVRIINGCYEALTGTSPVFLLGAADGLTIKGNYFEYNGGKSIDLTVNTRAVAHVGVEVANNTEWNSPENRDALIPMIKWGKFNGNVVSSCNTSRGLTHDPSIAGSGTIISTGDVSLEGSVVLQEHAGRVAFADKALTRWDSWTPTVVWTTGTPSDVVVKAKYKQAGKTCHFAIYVTATNGNGATRATFTLPLAALNDGLMHAFSATRDVAGVFAPIPAYFISSGGTITARMEGAPATAGSSMGLAVSGSYELA